MTLTAISSPLLSFLYFFLQILYAILNARKSKLQIIILKIFFLVLNYVQNITSNLLEVHNSKLYNVFVNYNNIISPRLNDINRLCIARLHLKEI